MVRPKRFRQVWNDVNFDYFKPKGVSLSQLEEINLNVEELEAVRLNDFLEMEQIVASEKMKVSQPTYSRILKEARKKIADALINGKAIKIHGGVYKMPGGDGTGPFGTGRGVGMGAGRGLGRGAGRGRMGGQFAAGPEGICVCTSCGNEITHVRGQPCNQIKCPKCNSMMTRK